MKGLSYLALIVLATMGGHAFAMQEEGLIPLTDTELSAETGQALFNKFHHPTKHVII